MTREEKSQVIQDLTAQLTEGSIFYLADISGLDALSTSNLRRACFKANVKLSVVKNTLLKIASSQNEINLGNELFSGSTAIAISYDDPVSAAKIIKNFLKDHDLPGIKGILFEGSYLPASKFEKIANLPGKDESLSKIIVMLKSPMQNIVNLLNSPMVKLLNVLNGLKENKN